MLRRITQVVVLAGCLAVAGQASAYGRGPGPALFGAVVGAMVGGAIVANAQPYRAPVYVQAAPPPPPQVVYYPSAPVYAPAYYGPPPGAYYYGPPPRW